MTKATTRTERKRSDDAPRPEVDRPLLLRFRHRSVSVAKEGIRVLQEIMLGAKKPQARGGKRRGRPLVSKNKKSQAATVGTVGRQAATHKRRGRPKKATAYERSPAIAKNGQWTAERRVSGTKLYSARDATGQFKDIERYKRAHG